MDELLCKSIEAVKNQGVQRNPVEAGAVVQNKVKPPYPTLLLQRTYPLNKSRSKFATVGLSCSGSFGAVVVLHGQKNDWVLLDEVELKTLCEYQSIIRSYYYSGGDFQHQPVVINNLKKICFRAFGAKKVILLQELCGSEVYLGIESVVELWELLPLINYRKEVLKSLEFSKFYSNIIRGVASLPGDCKSNIESVLLNLNINSENVLCMREMLKYAEDIIRCDVEFDQLGQQINY